MSFLHKDEVAHELLLPELDEKEEVSACASAGVVAGDVEKRSAQVLACVGVTDTLQVVDSLIEMTNHRIRS